MMTHAATRAARALVSTLAASRRSAAAASHLLAARGGLAAAVAHQAATTCARTSRCTAVQTRVLHTRCCVHTATSASSASVASSSSSWPAPPTAAAASASSTSAQSLNLASLGITSPFLRDRVRALGITLPTEIQAKAIPDLAAGRSVLLGAETGSGKTLTYLLPALDWLLSHPVEQAQRKYPRVIVLQPNRELCAQLESVIGSLIGASGARDLPVTSSPGSTTRLHYASLTGTNLFPPPACRDACDILILTPGALEHNLPLVDLARMRAKAIKQARAEEAAKAAGTEFKPDADADDDAQAAGEDDFFGDSVDGSASSSSKPRRSSRDPSSALTPTSFPGFHARGFDPLAFIAAQRIVVLDEADMLLESSGEALRVKKFLEQVWIKFEPFPGLERAPTQERRNRWRRDREGKKDRRAEAEEAERIEQRRLDELAATERRSLQPVPFGKRRQFVFVGATLSNISPLTTFQYLINTFTPRADQPPDSKSGPISLREDDLPSSCHLKLRLSSGFHHLSPGMSRPGTVQWTRVGPETRRTGPGAAWDPTTGIDEERLLAVDRANRSGNIQGGRHEEQALEDEARMLTGEALALRAKGARRLMKKHKLALNPSSAQGGAEGDEAKLAAPTRFEDETDLEKVAATVRFLNAHTPGAPSSGAGAESQQHPPLKSLMFVGLSSRVALLESHLRSLQSAHPSAESLASGSALSPHVQLLPYHADLKQAARVATMNSFNSLSPGGVHSVPTGLASTRVVPVAVTHQVLLCTSLAARGLDFNAAAPAAALRARAFAASQGLRAPPASSSDRGINPSTAQQAGFESLVQFDLATNVVDYIHRCGRMFRHRPATVSEAGADADAATQDFAQVDAFAAAPATSSAPLPSAPLAQVLNLYSADDELLVSHLRREGGVAPDAQLSPSDVSSSSSGAFISDAAFSRKRRLRNKAKKLERAAREAEEAAAHANDREHEAHG